MAIAKKTDRRRKIVTAIMESLKHDEIFDRLKYKQKTESELQNRMAIPLNRAVAKLFEEFKGMNEDKAQATARIKFASEEDPNTTVSNFMFMGVQHRPDFTIEFGDINIAVEIKKGEAGKSVREGIGQSIVYSQHFDFVCYLYVDASADSRIKNALQQDREQEFVKDLWKNHNIMFGVV